MNTVPLIISLLSGAAGGNVVARWAKKLDLGLVGNSLAGIVGGGIGGQLLGLAMGGTAATGGATDVASILGQLISGAVGGGILMAIIGAIKQFAESHISA